MTMYITVATTERVVQASDRRISIFQNGQYQQRNDSTNKSIVVDCRLGRFSIAYAGLAVLNSISMDNLLVDVFCEITKDLSSPKDLFERFAVLVSSRFKTIHIPDSYRHLLCTEFSIAGYLYNGGLFYLRVSNCQEPTGGRGELDDKFQYFGRLIERPTYQDRKKSAYIEIGGISDAHAEQIQKTEFLVLRRARFFHRTSADAVAEKLVEVIRRYAKKSQSRGLVGQNCMTTVLSRPPVSHSSFKYHSASGEQLQYGPHFVFNGMPIRNFKAGPIG